MALPKVSLTTKIFIGLILGILLGWLEPDWGIAMRPLSILFLNLIASPSGVADFAKRFPKLRVVTAFIDQGLNEKK